MHKLLLKEAAPAPDVMRSSAAHLYPRHRRERGEPDHRGGPGARAGPPRLLLLLPADRLRPVGVADGRGDVAAVQRGRPGGGPGCVFVC